ncbi:MAG: helix-turn-helix domain-containing protein [Immundisolibacteraceae bacterium]|nr:helix-turn-helix domain-containing protein [Immundisolibacteraceae bacterium]
MSQVTELIDTLKRLLRQRGLTYAMVGAGLGLSEASIKRGFASRSFTLERVVAICDLLEVPLAEVARQASAKPAQDQLSLQQEQSLVAEPQLLLVFFLLLNDYTASMISDEYQLTELGTQQLLHRLDQMGLIGLLPQNRVQLRVSRQLTWQPSGPIRALFDAQVKNEFLQAEFDGIGDQMMFLSGMLTDASVQLLQRRLLTLVSEFNGLLKEDGLQPIERRRGFSLLLATRNWTFSLFDQYKRSNQVAS